jgi:hypothetical protein
MGSCVTETVGGFDEFVNKQKQGDGKASLTLTQFDDEYEVVYADKDIQEVPSIKDIYQPRGCTALLDAIGRTVKDTETMLSKRFGNETPDRVLCVIITDGYENASKEWTRDKIVELIRDKEKGNWEFMFLSANLDAIAQAASMGIKAGSAATYLKGNNKVWGNVSKHAMNYRSADASQLESIKTCTSAMFTDEDREELSTG